MHDTDSIRRDHPIADVVVASGLQLRPTGGRLTGVCPFHGDTRPSLIVYPATQSYYCFGCGAGGDVIDFVARLNKMGFKEAVETLCGRAVQQATVSRLHCVSEGPAVDHEDAVRIVESTVDFYHGALWRTPKALAYLRSRGVREATIANCRLGFGESGLTGHLAKRGVDLDVARSLGLINGNRECFAGRVIIPNLTDGRDTWLTGRRLDEQEPRYLNLRTEKPILGLDRVKGDAVVLVEGPFDWLTAYGWGFDSAALLGTRVSDRVLRQLDRFAQVYLALDNDEVGRDAVRNLTEVLGPRAIPVHLPSGASDVSALAQEGGRPAFISTILRAASDARARQSTCDPAAGRAA
ncbi:MAG: toprim domain-containing protein [Chloroflexi bacterium]|nr:toprim domain-containing protein [Chloroflexota bacterium]